MVEKAPFCIFDNSLFWQLRRGRRTLIQCLLPAFLFSFPALIVPVRPDLFLLFVYEIPPVFFFPNRNSLAVRFYSVPIFLRRKNKILFHASKASILRFYFLQYAVVIPAISFKLFPAPGCLFGKICTIILFMLIYYPLR